MGILSRDQRILCRIRHKTGVIYPGFYAVCKWKFSQEEEAAKALEIQGKTGLSKISGNLRTMSG